LWDGRKADDKGWPVLAHGAGGAWLDFGSPDLAKLRRAADEEAAAEELRLAYVALTRAEHRCVLIWGKANLCERSPLAWLLFGPREPVEGDWRAWLAEKLKTSGEAALQAELAGLEERLGGALKMSPLPAGGKERAPVANETSVPLAARPFTATIPAPWRILSFSSLAARLAEGEAPDHDARGPLDAVWPAPTFETALAFPRGAHAGSCLHALFERCDFTDLSGLGELVATVLAEFGFSPQWRPALERLVADVVATPLAAGLRLADVASAARLSELEFVFPRAGGGYMKGYIDLVFRHAGRWYIVDWKSNWLGNAPEDYASARLEEVMRRHRYDLQMRIYAAALRRALAAREPELDWPACFGGVFYLFVRGMRPDLPHGIYFARPEVTESALWESET
ncbi:MAG: PD-(D/E)XK nuclease family protein, partial [Rhodocyclaceae bacterium]|nr:PD-(D/E)XK nuclease family protein [Rhodocyclaceae bacterium]